MTPPLLSATLIPYGEEIDVTTRESPLDRWAGVPILAVGSIDSSWRPYIVLERQPRGNEVKYTGIASFQDPATLRSIHTDDG